MHAQWEYLTVTVEANVDASPIPVSDDIPLQAHPKYSTYSLMPQLNRLGAKGWELMSMQPVIVGKNGDVQLPTSGYWAQHYLCAFKRPL